MQRLTEAFEFALIHHPIRKQLWKDTESPFLFHPMAVASLVLKFGGTEEQAVAALLHDTIGDEAVTRAEVTSRFGEEVARLVFAFADPELPAGTEPGWRNLKQAYLKKLGTLDEAALMVIACEELQDGGELLHDLRYRGVQVWKRYTVHGMEVFWYYRELLAIFNRGLSGARYRALLGEYSAVVRSLKGIIFEGAVY